MGLLSGGDAFSVFNEPPDVGAFTDATRTVLEVMQAVKRQFGDESGVQLEDSDIIRLINDAQDEMVRRNRMLKATSSLMSIPGQLDYTFPTENILSIESIHFDGFRIPNMSFAQAEEEVIANPDSTVPAVGTPVLWYEWGGRIVFYPVPDIAKRIAVYYTKKPNKVTTSTDILGVPDKYYQDVVRYVLREAFELDEDATMAQLKGQQFDASLDQMGEEERTSQNLTYSTITLYDS